MLGYQISSKYALEPQPRTPVRNICVPFNFSDAAFAGLRYATFLTQLIKSEMTVLNCFQSTALNSGSSTDVDYATSTYERKTELLDSIPQLNEIDCSFMVEHAFLSTIVPQLNAQEKIDMVVMGSEISGDKERMFGTNASSLINQLNAPLIIVPDDIKEVKLRQILFAADYKDIHDLSRFRILKAIANMIDARLHIVHVSRHEPEKVLSSDERHASEELKKFFDGIDYEIHCLYRSNIHRALHEYVDLKSIDLMAMVPRQHGFLESLYHPSETKRMALDTSVPLMVFHDN